MNSQVHEIFRPLLDNIIKGPPKGNAMNLSEIIATGMELTRQALISMLYPSINLHFTFREYQESRIALEYAHGHDTGRWEYSLLGNGHDETVTAEYLCRMTLFIPLAHFEQWVKEEK